MNIRSANRIKVLFSNTHDELLSDKANAGYKIDSLLHLLIAELKYTPEFSDDSIDKFLNSEILEDYNILVLGAPTKDLREEECLAIEQFLENGGGLLLLCNSHMLMDAFPCLEGFIAKQGIEIHEYHNTQPEIVDIFYPHALTANIKYLRVSDVAVVAPTIAKAYPIAYTEITTTPILVREKVAACLDLQDCSNPKSGRIVVIGDVSFCSDEFIEHKDNKQFISNTFQWLVHRNPLDIKEVSITETVYLGENGQVGFILQRSNIKEESYIDYILESDSDTIIDAPLRGRTIQAEKPVVVNWSVKPQNLGMQGLQLVVRIEQKLWSRFQLLPDMCCLAPGKLILEILDMQRRPKLSFEKEESFIVKGILHTSSGIQRTPSMKLECYEGLAYGDPFYLEPCVWNLKAIESGVHRITLSIPITGQTVSTFVIVKPSEYDRRTELYISYVNPLDAEIAGRLKKIDKRLCDNTVRDSQFTIALLDEYITRVYAEPSRKWLQEILIAARREEKQDIKLIDHILTYFYPTYQPQYNESLIPYAPSLVSYLTSVYPGERRNLESIFICSEESDAINIKQHIAAYLLHEKYGHGFFYTQTLLGKQLTILDQYKFSEESDTIEFQEVVQFIRDSSIVVNEGFAAWLEISFLKQLTDSEIKLATDQRHKFLILEATGFLQKSVYRKFFKMFPPRYDSSYREGFEYLDFITRAYNVGCAIDAFMIATQINFGIPVYHSNGEFCIDKDRFNEMKAFFEKDNILEEEAMKWLSHLRLRQIAEVLYRFKEKLELPVRRHYSLPAIDENAAQLQTVIINDLEGRGYHE